MRNRLLVPQVRLSPYGIFSKDMTKDLHSFLKEYERDFPAEVVHIEKDVDARYEVTALVANTLRAKEGLR